MLAPELVACVYGHPLLRSLQVQHLDFTDIRSAAQLVQVPVLDDNQAGCTGAIVELGQHGPAVSCHIVHLAGTRAFVAVPRTDHNNIPVQP
jgi:hypothetical protein